MMMKSSQPKETKWEKRKCKRWEGPRGQGIADPFNDLTEEIGSRNVREQATCVRKNQVSHLRFIIAMLEPLCFVPKHIRAPRSKAGLETACRVRGVWWNPLGEKGRQCRHPVVLRTSWKDEEWPESLDGLHPDLWQLLDHWLREGWERRRDEVQEVGACFILLSNISSHLWPQSFPGHPHCLSPQQVHHHTKWNSTLCENNKSLDWSERQPDSPLVFALPLLQSSTLRSSLSSEWELQGFSLLETGEVYFYRF